MNKIAILSAAVLAYGGLLSAQGLYNIMPYDDEPVEALPLNWTAGASVGYDSNPMPTFSEVPGVDTKSSGYISAFVQGNWVSKTPQTTWDIWGRVGITYYLKKPEQKWSLPGGDRITRTEDQYFPSLRGGVNLVHRFNERTRFRSMNYVTYETEPDFDYGLGTDRRQGPYTAYSTDNSLGHRWTERFATNTGFRISGVKYHDFDGSDYIRYLFYNQFRYRSSPTTVWTTSIRYGITDNDRGRDTQAWYFLVGAEHEVSPTTVVVWRFGGQYYQPDGGTDSWSPYFEGTVKSQLSEVFSVRAFARYGIEGNNTSTSTGIDPATLISTRGSYEGRNTFRIGVGGSYILSPKVTLFGGGAWVYYKYEDLVAGTGPNDLKEWILNLNIGASYEINPNLYLTTSYNFDKGDSDTIVRDFNRHRVQVGMQAAF